MCQPPMAVWNSILTIGAMNHSRRENRAGRQAVMRQEFFAGFLAGKCREPVKSSHGRVKSDSLVSRLMIDHSSRIGVACRSQFATRHLNSQPNSICNEVSRLIGRVIRVCANGLNVARMRVSPNLRLSGRYRRSKWTLAMQFYFQPRAKQCGPCGWGCLWWC